jgi:hypothetical protein
LVSQEGVVEESEAQRSPIPRIWTGYTPAGQHLAVQRHLGVWIVICDDHEPVRHRLLDVALVEALRSDVELHWHGVDQATWTRLIADSILSSWQKNG